MISAITIGICVISLRLPIQKALPGHARTSFARSDKSLQIIPALCSNSLACKQRRKKNPSPIKKDGVYTNIGDDPRFRNVDPITGDEVAALVERIAHSVMRYLKSWVTSTRKAKSFKTQNKTICLRRANPYRLLQHARLATKPDLGDECVGVEMS